MLGLMKSLKPYRQPREFRITGIDQTHHLLQIEDQLSGLKIEIPYGSKTLKHAQFIAEFELLLSYDDGSEKTVNLLMQGY